MKDSSKARYAVAALVDLACQSSQQPTTLAAIAKRQDISVSYLEQLFARLRANGLIKSVRGPGGGYVLARASHEITIADIYGATHISERHRHRYEVNTHYRERLEKAGLRFAGMSPDGLLPETVEYPDHPWFIGVQFHPELKSKPLDPHPLFASFIGAAVQKSRLV